MTDQEIIHDALCWYTNKRHEFASAIAQKIYRNSDGSIPTMGEVRQAMDFAERCDGILLAMGAE